MIKRILIVLLMLVLLSACMPEEYEVRSAKPVPAPLPETAVTPTVIESYSIAVELEPGAWEPLFEQNLDKGWMHSTHPNWNPKKPWMHIVREDTCFDKNIQVSTLHPEDGLTDFINIMVTIGELVPVGTECSGAISIHRQDAENNAILGTYSYVIKVVDK